MARTKADIKADILENRGESVAAMEPMVLSSESKQWPALIDLALDVAARSAGLRSSLPPGIWAGLADLVRAMNCYYSNLIEGHDTHPVDIERALKNDYSADLEKRNLQLEALAHIEVQRWIDGGCLRSRAATTEGLREIHRRFCTHLPDELSWVTEPRTGRREHVESGELRRRDVRVGQLIGVSPGALPRFLQRFEEVYQALGKTQAIIAAAAAHHRLLWIHPFLDANGRVARLMSHAMLLDLLDTGGVWSVARGLGRNIAAYKGHLSACDLPRRNDLDGRGNLSEEELVNFTRFFLETCIDQVEFMQRLVQPDRLRARILLWAQEEAQAGTLPHNAATVLEAVLYRGALPRGDVSSLLLQTPRHARRIVASLIGRGVLVAESPRAPLRLAFPAALASRWMPGLFPDHPTSPEQTGRSASIERPATGSRRPA